MRIIKLSCISFFILSFVSCGLLKNSIKPPNTKILDVKTTSLSLQEVNFDIILEIENINNIGVELSNISYNLDIKENTLLEGFKNKNTIIKPKSKDTITIPIRLNIAKVFKSLGDSYENSTIDYKIKISPTIKVPILGNIKIPLNFKGEIPLPKVPSISIEDIKINKISFTKIKLTLDLKIKGNGGMNLYVDNLYYNFGINDNNWLKSKVEERLYISGEKEQIIKVPMEVSILDIGKILFKNIRKNFFNTRYSLQGGYTLGSEEYDYFNPINENFNKKGNTKIKN